MVQEEFGFFNSPCLTEKSPVSSPMCMPNEYEPTVSSSYQSETRSSSLENFDSKKWCIDYGISFLYVFK